MMEVEVAKALFRLSFAGGFALATLFGMLVLAVFFALRLWTLRDELKDMNESLTELMRTLDREAQDGRDRNL